MANLFIVLYVLQLPACLLCKWWKNLNQTLGYLLESPVMKQHKILCRKLIIIWWGGIHNSGHSSHEYLTLRGLTSAVFSFVF